MSDNGANIWETWTGTPVQIEQIGHPTIMGTAQGRNAVYHYWVKSRPVSAPWSDRGCQMSQLALWMLMGWCFRKLCIPSSLSPFHGRAVISYGSFHPIKTIYSKHIDFEDVVVTGFVDNLNRALIMPSTLIVKFDTFVRSCKGYACLFPIRNRPA